MINNLRVWSAQYTIIYQNSGTNLHSKWKNSGFTEVATMDWSPILENELEGESCWGEKPTPKWFLLKASP